jgi:hypothetical protein
MQIRRSSLDGHSEAERPEIIGPGAPFERHRGRSRGAATLPAIRVMLPPIPGTATQVPPSGLKLLLAWAADKLRRRETPAMADLHPHLMRDMGLLPCELIYDDQSAAARPGRW